MVEELLENNIFNSFLNLIPYLPSFFDDDVLFSVSDREKYIKIVGADVLNLNVKDGDLISHDGADFEAMKYGKTTSKIIDKSVFGNAIKSIAVPIKNKAGQVIGCISVVKSLKRQDEILNISSSLSSSLEQISSVVSNITEGIQAVASSTEEIVAGVETTNNDAKNTDEIIRFVKNVADQTNLLGLNAAIEAARAGEMGRGFSVVAQEIRKLSHSSGESIKKIDDVLKNIQKSISGITDRINSTNSIFQDQAASLEEISASIQELNSTAHVLAEISSKL